MSREPITSLHYAANGDFNGSTYTPFSYGFNLVDVSSPSLLSVLPSGSKALVYLGMTDGVTSAFIAAVNAYIGQPNIFGFYLADEPDPSVVSAANLKAESDYIHSHVPGAKTFIVEYNQTSDTNPTFGFTPANTGIDLYGLDPYPVNVNVPGGLDYGIIPAAVSEALKVGIPLSAIVPVYQTFGGGGYSTYILPTAAQEQQILATWGSVVPNPVFDYAYSWGVQQGDTALANDAALAAVLKAHNANASSPTPTPTPTPTPPAAPAFVSPASGQAVANARPTITGTGIPGDIVTLRAGAVVLSSSITVGADGTWSYTPASAFAAGFVTLSATQAKAGGSSSPAATDSFTVNLAAGLTLASARTGTLSLTSAMTPLVVTSAGSVTASSGDAIDGASGANWTIANAGRIKATGSNAAGVYFAGSGGTVQNAGTIAGVAAGVWTDGGGQVTNGAGGVISGSLDYGIYMAGAGTVANAGTLSGAGYAVYFANASAANRVIAQPGAAFHGGVFGNGGTLELAGGTGVASGVGTDFSGFQQLLVDAGGAWTLNGSNSVASVKVDGELVVAKALTVGSGVDSTSAGRITVASGASLEIAADAAVGSHIRVQGSARLILDNASLFGTHIGQSTYAGPKIEDFGVGDSIDIGRFSANGAKLAYDPAHGLLQVGNGAGQSASLAFDTATIGKGAFGLASDGRGGLQITHG